MSAEAGHKARMSRASNSMGRSIVLPTGDVLTTCSCSACSASSSASLSTRAVASRPLVARVALGEAEEHLQVDRPRQLDLE